MLDSRIIDLHFNKVFLKLVLGEEVPLTIATLKVSQAFNALETSLTVLSQLVDVDLANSLMKVQNIVSAKHQTPSDKVRKTLREQKFHLTVCMLTSCCGRLHW